MAKRKVNVKGTEIVVFSKEKEDYISLTDIAKYKDSERTNYIIQNWMRSRNTIEFIGLWELLHNPDFKGIEFDAFKNEAGSNSFTLTPKRWITATNAIGIISKSGRYGGTYAHQDIAFEFASWISAEFKLYLLKEFQRLKQAEIDQKKLEWNVSRTLANLLVARVKGLGLKVAIRKAFADSGKVILLPDNFIAFPNDLIKKWKHW